MPALFAVLPGWMELTSEWVKIVVGIITVGGGLIAAFKFLHEYQRDLKLRAVEQQQRDEERTRQHVNLSRELLTTLFNDQLSRDALRMLDWEARKYPVGNQILTVTKRDVVNGLRIGADRPEPRPDGPVGEMQPPGVNIALNFTPEEQYVRDCFERLYDQLDSLEHFIRRKLLDLADLHTPLAYYIREINARPEQEKFLVAYGYTLTQAFLLRPLPPPQKAPAAPDIGTPS
jgi:hypothetical protein